jgi:hypothetical protein
MLKRTLLVSIVISVVLVSGCRESIQKTQPQRQTKDVKKTTQEISQKQIAEDAPRIEFEELIHNFGSIGPGTKNICEFEFKNTGKSNLHIDRVTKTCGCTPFSLEKKDYAPGESGTLKISYHASKRPGSTSKRLTIYTNDPKNPKTTLTIKAKIVEKVSYQPERMTLSLKENNADCPEITLKSLDGEPFAIKSFKATGNTITAEFDSNQKKDQFVLTPRVDIEKLKKVSSGRIQIEITHPELDEVTIFFDTIKQFKLNPPRIVYLKAEPGKTINRKVWVLNNYNESFEVESVKSEGEIMKVVEQKDIGDNRYEISVDITAPEKEGSNRIFRDNLTIKIKNGETLEVPCTGFFSDN